MDLLPTAWRALPLCLATTSLLLVGCGRESPSEGIAEGLPSSKASTEAIAPQEFQLTEHSQEILRLPLPEFDNEALPEIRKPEIQASGDPVLAFSNPYVGAAIAGEAIGGERRPIDLPLSAEEADELGDMRGDESFGSDSYEEEAYAPPFDIYSRPVEPALPNATDNALVVPSDPAQVAPTPGRVFSTEEYDEDAEYAAKTTADDVLSYFPAEAELSAQFRPKVQAAFALARNGALHAARGRFESLLVEIARAKDASQMTNRHSRALAAGLRALNEADDFVASGGESEVQPFSLAASHQTPMLRAPFVKKDEVKWTLPHEAIAMYHRYAERKLAAAVAGEQAGSMALYGLGKIYQQLGERRDDIPQVVRKSLTMYRSALIAHSKNHLAANEAGVLLARAGRYGQSLPLLERALELAPSSVTHKNLAFVFQKQGASHLAQAHGRESQKLAAREKARGDLSAERGIAWMSPKEFNRRSGHGTAAPLAGVEPTMPRANVPPARPQMASAPRLPPARNLRPAHPATPAPQPTLWW